MSSSRNVYLLCSVSAAVLHGRLNSEIRRAVIPLKPRGERCLTVMSVFIITLSLTTSPTPLAGLQRQTTREHPLCFIVDNQSLSSIHAFYVQVWTKDFRVITPIDMSLLVFKVQFLCNLVLSLNIASWQQTLCCDHFWSGFSKRERDRLKGQMLSQVLRPAEFFFHFLRKRLCL